MRSVFFLILSVLGFAVLPARADIKLWMESSPAGATIDTSGGPVPTPAYFKLKTNKKAPCVKVSFTITWVSGASVTDELGLCQAGGKERTFRVKRPTGVDGLEVDVQYELQSQLIEQLEGMRRQLERMGRQMDLQTYLASWQEQQRAWAALQESIVRSRQNLALQQQIMGRSLFCTSQIVGRFVYTNCR